MALEGQNYTFIDWLNYHSTLSWWLNFQQVILSLLKNKEDIFL